MNKLNQAETLIADLEQRFGTPDSIERLFLAREIDDELIPIGELLSQRKEPLHYCSRCAVGTVCGWRAGQK